MPPSAAVRGMKRSLIRSNDVFSADAIAAPPTALTVTDGLPPPPVPEFIPVPLRYRKDGWTPERQRRYVAALAETGHLGKAARAVGMTEQSAGKLRRRPGAASFAAACMAAYRAPRRRWMLARLAATDPRQFERFKSFFPLGSGNL